MFCGKCGTEVKDGARFCHGCGARLETGAEDYSYSTYPDTYSDTYSETGEYIPPVQTGVQSGKKFPKAFIWIGAAIASVALVAGIVAAVVFSNPAATVAKAISKSSNAFSSAVDGTNLTNIGALVEKKDSSQKLSVSLQKFEEAPELNGLGVRASLDSSLSKRTVAVGVTPFFGSADLVNLQVKVEGDNVYIGSPELTGGTYYMINTVTVGEDLDDLFGMSDLRGLGYNLFDLIEEAKSLSSQNEQMQKVIDEACEEFVKAIEVEKAGTKTVEVNGTDLKCKAYNVVITDDACYDLLDGLQEAYMIGQNTDAYLTLLESVGIPDEVIDELAYSLEYSQSDVEYAFDEIREYVEEIGDVELELYINKGYVVAAVCELSVYEADMEFILNIGGGKNYVDDISLRMIMGDEELSIVSTGNHAGAGGEFTDETVVKLNSYGQKQSLAKMETRYAPKEKNDNFEWQLKAEDVKFSAEGQIACSRDELTVNLEKVKLDDYLTFGIEYSFGKYKKDNITVTDSLALSDMTEDMLMEEYSEISDNLGDWLMGLVEEFPDLAWYLY